MSERRFAVVGEVDTVIRDTAIRPPCPDCGGFPFYETGIWDDKPGDVTNSIELVGYERKCLAGHVWSAKAYSANREGE